MPCRNHFAAILLFALPPAAVYGTEPFLPHQDFLFSGSTNDVATGDIDQDGYPDMAIASNGVYIYINDGEGKFEEGQRIRLNNDMVNKVDLADLDRDGDLDLIAGRNGSPIEIYWNDGSGTYPDKGYLFSAEYSAPVHLFIADINDDGAPDILTQNINNRLKVFLNAGNGEFPATSRTLLGSRYENKIALAWLDGNSSPDLVSWDDHHEIKFLHGNRDGTFDHNPQADVTSENLYELAVGDLTGDNRDDVLLVEFEGFRVLINSGSGFMRFRNVDLGVTPKDVSAITLADMNDDGYDDVILSVGRQENLLFINDREESFVRSPAILGGENVYVTGISALDIDGDRDNDLLFSSRSPAVYANTMFEPDESRRAATPAARPSTTEPPPAGPRRVAFDDGVAISHQQRIERFELADINGDGLPDLTTLTVADHNPVFSFFLNNGDGTIDTHGSLQGPARQEVGDIHFADIDGDGDADLLIGWLDQYITIHRNDGRGSFDPAGQALSNSTIRTRSLLTGLVNNDAYVDIVATGDRRTQIHFSTGDGRFITDHMSGLPTDSGEDAALVDLDDDGDQDLVISSDELVIYYNRGNGSFTMPGTEFYNPNEFARQIFILDIDNDGDDDLLAGGGGTYLFVNEGDGVFADYAHLSTLDNIALGDLEGDGNIDIVSYRNGMRSEALTGDGRGGWIPGNEPIIVGSPPVLRLVDFDGDGDPDIITGGRDHRQLTLYTNLGIHEPKRVAAPKVATPTGQADGEAPASAGNVTQRESGGFLEAMSLRKAIFALGLAFLVVLTLRLLRD